MSKIAWLTAVVALASVLAGCGGGGNGGGGGGGGGGEAREAPTVPGELDDPGAEGLDEEFGAYEGSQAYIEAGFTCGTGIDYLAQQYGVKATPEAVARAVANEKKSKKDREDAYKGCLDTLKAK